MRNDLLALDEDALSTLANRGIVKRAAREVAESKGPDVAEADGVVTGTFGDGIVVTLPVGVTLERAPCSCPSTAVCRHRVMTVLAYQALSSSAVGAVVPWSPAEFSDEELEALIGARVLTVARKALRTGFRARVRRPTPDDPTPTVELPSCTVRFLVPHELGYARVDAAAGTRTDAIALATWAYRAADEQSPAEPVVDLMVGGATLDASSNESGMEALIPLLLEVLREGVTQLGPALAPTAARSRDALDRANLRWPVDALDDLLQQVTAYRERSSHYSSITAAALLAELIARHRCVAGRGASLRSDVLGTEETSQTALRLVRLTGLGARVVAEDDEREVQVYLAHPEAGVVLTLQRRHGEAQSGEDLGRRKTNGARLSALAGGNVVSESAVRSANRQVRIAESRLAKTTVSPSAGDWGDLPGSLLVEDLDAEAARLAGLPPSFLRPRQIAETLRAVRVIEVLAVSYRPGQQRLEAVIQAPVGEARLSLEHTVGAPGAVDALAAALSGEVRFVAGHVRRHAGSVVIEPTAVVAGRTVVVPAFAAAVATGALAVGLDQDEPLTAAINEALAVSADVLHRGWHHLPASWTTRAQRSVRQLLDSGFQDAAGALERLVAGTRNFGEEPALQLWADTHLRLMLTAEQL